MSSDERKLCVVCAWRGTCAMKYSMPGGIALHCVEFTRDVTLQEPEAERRKRNVLKVENQYTRSARRQGNPHARALVQEIFEPLPQTWRGMGLLPNSGLALRPDYAGFDESGRSRERRRDLSQYDGGRHRLTRGKSRS